MRLPMDSSNPKRRAHRMGLTDVPVDDHAGNAEPAPAPLAGRERRPRFAGVSSADDGHVQAGAIAVSFAVVSRRRWPR